jgi:hypothetical protein
VKAFEENNRWRYRDKPFARRLAVGRYLVGHLDRQCLAQCRGPAPTTAAEGHGRFMQNGERRGASATGPAPRARCS